TAFFTAADQMIEAPPILPETFNLLIKKRFFVSTTSEVGRIIRGSEGPSTVNFIKVKYRGKTPRQGCQLPITALAPI
ncbi:hypothetical protein, partial [Pseudomonas mosselii]|uniref:hypothetical protein n=1 Tax=Pseudomonas mosselii TaxID=78327 RepID=UPI00300CC998